MGKHPTEFVVDELAECSEADIERVRSWLRGDAYQRLMHGIFVESKEAQDLRGLAQRYHRECDAYDRQVCSGTSPRTGEAMPMSGEELGNINAHARRVRNECIRAGQAMGYSEAQVNAAIKQEGKHRCPREETAKESKGHR